MAGGKSRRLPVFTILPIIFSAVNIAFMASISSSSYLSGQFRTEQPSIHPGRASVRVSWLLATRKPFFGKIRNEREFPFPARSHVRQPAVSAFGRGSIFSPVFLSGALADFSASKWVAADHRPRGLDWGIACPHGQTAKHRAQVPCPNTDWILDRWDRQRSRFRRSSMGCP